MSHATDVPEPSAIEAESRHYMAAYVLFNQAVADHLGMHPTDVQCLNLMAIEPGPFTAKRIAEMTGLTSGSATRLVDRLEAAGYVARERDTADRRRVLVRLVPEGMARFGELWRELGPGWREIIADNSPAEQEVLLRHMRRTIELSQRQIAALRSKGKGGA